MDHYEFTDYEQQEIDKIKSGIAQHGKLVKCDQVGLPILEDGKGIPLPFQVVHGARYCVDPQGRVWQFAKAGTPKIPGKVRGGKLRRCDMISMWTGHWRKVIRVSSDPELDGVPAYAKNIIWVPVGRGVNEHPDMTHLDWYERHKGFKHPFAPPHAPTEQQLRVLERKATEAKDMIYAQVPELVAEHGGDVDKVKAVVSGEPVPETPTPPEPPPVPKPKKKPKRTNRRKPKAKPNATEPKDG